MTEPVVGEDGAGAADRGWWDELQRLDGELFRRIAERHDPVLDRVLPALSRAADFSVLWLVTAGVLAVSGRSSWRRAAVRGLASVAVASATANLVIKPYADRRRPPLHLVARERRVRRIPVTTSFPSGHSASAAAFAVGVAREAPELALPVGLLASAVALSRIWTGAHYPSDVVVGVAVGATAGALLPPYGR